jgi:hypothetical protein
MVYREQFIIDFIDSTVILSSTVILCRKKKKSKVVLIRDKLFVNNELVIPDEATHLEPRRSTTRPNKRTRVNSTPERDDPPA